MKFWSRLRCIIWCNKAGKPSVDVSLCQCQLKLQLFQTFFCILLISNRIVSREIWIKQTLVSFSMLFEKLNRARFIQIALVTILYSIIPILTYITVLTIYTIIITAKNICQFLDQSRDDSVEETINPIKSCGFNPCRLAKCLSDPFADCIPNADCDPVYYDSSGNVRKECNGIVLNKKVCALLEVWILVCVKESPPPPLNVAWIVNKRVPDNHTCEEWLHYFSALYGYQQTGLLNSEWMILHDHTTFNMVILQLDVFVFDGG